MTEDTAAKPSSPNAKPTKAFSCVRCFERKVKCDREHPCAGCVRANVECEFRIPAPPRRKKKRTQEDILTERLNQYEQILQQKGISIQNVPVRQGKPRAPSPIRREPVDASDPGSSVPTTTITTEETDSRAFVSPKLLWEDSRSRYTENNLWTRVTEEFQQSQDGIHESSDEEDEEAKEHEADDNIDFTLGLTPASSNARNLHPLPEHVSVLWHVFLDNINPFSMIIHRPTMGSSIRKAMQNLDHAPRGLEALMFSIYSAAVYSMQDREVENTFGESRQVLLSRYRNATKAALSRAKFMGSSDITVLQALVVHMFSMRDVYDGRTLWTLSGVAIRIGEGMGLHRDGTSLGLPPFATEMRRRLWYQISTLEYRSAELSGSNKFKSFRVQEVHTRPPLNVNDDDLWPSMTEFPTERFEITDMVLCSLRYEFMSFWTEKLKAKGSQSAETVWENYASIKDMGDKDTSIDELEQIMADKYVKHCDLSKPVHLMASFVAMAAPASMRFMAHHPRRWATDEEIPEADRKILWSLSMRIMETYVTCMTTKSLKRFSWHTEFFFQWQAFIYLLDYVRAHPLMPEADEAWRHVDAVLEVHPNFISNTKKAIHVAVGSLCLKAYNAKEQAFKREGRFLPAKPPEYILILRKQRDEALRKQAERRARSKAAQLQHPSQSLTPDSAPGSTGAELIQMMGFEASPGQFGTPSPNIQHQHQVPHQQPNQLQHQQPLPLFQPSTSNSATLPHKQADAQVPVPYWFDSFNGAASQFTGADTDWMMLSDPMTDQGSQMDWNQWDYLLQDSGGLVGFGDTRATM